MLTGEDIAWVIYSTILILLTTVLAVRCRHNLLLLPFIVFAILSTISHLVMLARRYQSDSVILLADRSPIINHIPIFSLLLYAALIECQLMYIQHVNTSYQNRDHWNSRDLDDPEKQQQRRQRQSQQQSQQEQQQQQQRKQNSIRLKRSKTYWANVCMLITYTCLVVALVCVRLALNDNLGSTRLIMALCITALAVLAASNALFVFLAVVPTPRSSSSSTTATATAASTKTNNLYRDGCFLKATMLSFTISMIGMAAEAWLFFSMIVTHETYNFTTLGWIMFETCLVYLPIFAILIMCLFVRQIHLLGLQQATTAEARCLRFLRQRRRKRRSAAADHEVDEDDIYSDQQQHQQQRFSHDAASEAATGLRRPDAAALSNNM
ncbi:hypothetical protein BDB00DRAFT_489485 [Zychaea mexicana]|uniref:uncharacterized protein n=1 Tax=Zychaea mexicana TaxID=64656 RepID=UPI0022FE88BE|nr:uncharacterized protein BDB00DRAFT_489485 [Zychaea mexicana]KAI9491413.1 hypothetical protein BDB00DRAFT_489485 [Zychaea mexicana]